jgi:Uma2 family endonuclease
MTALAEPEVLVQRVSIQMPVGYLTAADLPNIDVDDVPFEIEDGALVLMPPPSPWHAETAFNLHTYLRPKYPHVTAEVDVALGDNVRRPDVLAVSLPLSEALRSGALNFRANVVELVIEIISHGRRRSMDSESVSRDRVTKFYEYARAGIPEYWIVDEVEGDLEDASVEMYRLKDGAYGLIRTVLLSELLAEDGPEKTA